MRFGGLGRAALMGLVVVGVMPASAMAQSVVMRRPIQSLPGGQSTPVTNPGNTDPDVNEPDSACDANSPRQVIDAQWIPVVTPGADNADGSCTNTRTEYHCSIVTRCAVGGSEIPVTSDAPDSSCEAFFGPAEPNPS